MVVVVFVVVVVLGRRGQARPGGRGSGAGRLRRLVGGAVPRDAGEGQEEPRHVVVFVVGLLGTGGGLGGRGGRRGLFAGGDGRGNAAPPAGAASHGVCLVN